MSKVVPAQKFGYIEIKQSSKVRPRKLKSWKRRWAVLTQMSNLSSEEYVVKLDLYDNDNKWRTNSSDKMTLVLENVTCIRPVKSKTHQHAFEVVEDRPVLVISGATELESYSWILSLQQIFTPEQIEAKKDCYHVTISTNEHSERWSLSGDYNLTVCTTSISLARTAGTSVISWGLNTLIKFHVKQNPVAGQTAVLVIECGPNAPTGQSCFHFLTNEAQDILSTIRQSICLALALKQSTRNVQTARQRSLSATISEKGFQKLLDNYTAPQLIPQNRSNSCSSGSSLVGSLTNASMLSSSPVSPLVTHRFSTDRGLFVEFGGSIHDLQLREEAITSEKGIASFHKRSSSQPDKPFEDIRGYRQMRDVSADQKFVRRRVTLGCEPRNYDLNQLRSVSDVFASLKASNEHSNWKSFSFRGDNDDISDLDSAISLSMSATNDDLTKTDALLSLMSDCSDVLFHASYLNHRRRSSSTPDLQAYRKLHENVYEELDELRDSVQRLNMKRDSDVPPELPARPLFINLTGSADLHTNSTSAKKHSLLKWYGQTSCDNVQENAATLCTCESLKNSRYFFDSGDGQCNFCGGKILTEQSKPNSKASTNEALANYSFSDVNAIILHMQNVKHRRSSDVTPVPPSFLLSTLKPYSNCTKTSNFRCEGLERFPKNPGTHANLINIEDKTDIFDLGIIASNPLAKSVEDNPSDSLMQFSLDETFNWNPVEGEEHAADPSSDCEHLPKSISNVPIVPVSDDLDLTQQNRTPTWHSQNIVNCVDDPNMWGNDLTNIISNSNSATDTAFPAFFTSHFSQ